MTTEEKAKRYDEAIERAKRLHSEPTGGTERIVCEQIFPELKESEDERIRKALVKHCREQLDIYKTLQTAKEYGEIQSWIAWLEKQEEIKIPKWIFDFLEECRPYIGCALGYDERRDIEGKVVAVQKWLEKQGEQKKTPEESLGIDSATYNKIVDEVIYGEQKLSNKVKPMFNVGEWVVDRQGLTHQIERVVENVTTHTFGYDIVGGGYFNDNTEGVRLWTIQDAKEGDVLVDVYGNIGIFEQYDDFDWTSYCSLGVNGGFQHFKVEHENEKTYPATTEQRETLEKVISDAGYEWNADTKELKKIEQEYHCTGVREPKEATGVLKQLLNKENYAWSDEDEAYRVDILVKLEPHITDDNFTDVQNWFKSIKDRVQPQPKQEWSEEDKVWIDRACMLLNELNDLSNLTPAKIPSNVNKIIQQLNSIKDRVQPKVELTQLDKNILEAAIAFVEQNNHFNCWGGIDKHTVLSALRSLRPRNNWKPSDEQMKALADALSLAKNCGEESSFYLRRLYEQLKKLKKKNKL